LCKPLFHRHFTPDTNQCSGLALQLPRLLLKHAVSQFSKTHNCISFQNMNTKTLQLIAALAILVTSRQHYTSEGSTEHAHFKGADTSATAVRSYIKYILTPSDIAVSKCVRETARHSRVHLGGGGGTATIHRFNGGSFTNALQVHRVAAPHSVCRTKCTPPYDGA
jgi:hypothetical protein